MKKLALLVMVMLVAVALTAHEFWIQPDRFLYKAGETIYLRFWIGENFEGENWNGNRASVESIRLQQNDLDDGLTTDLGENTGDSLEISLHDEGTAMITMQTSKHFIVPGSDSAGKGNYQRSVKTIIQVGDELSNCCLKKTELALDIIPLVNPYDPAVKDSLRFKVQFNGAILKNQLVNIWHRTNNQTEKLESLTNDRGLITVPIEKNGKYMISTVNMIRIAEKDDQSQSYWGSCTWGYYR